MPSAAGACERGQSACPKVSLQCCGRCPCGPPRRLTPALKHPAAPPVPRRLPRATLQALPTDLAQQLLDRLVATERLDEAALAALRGQHFFSLDLTAYSRPVTEGWLRVLCTESLEAAVLSKTQVSLCGCAQVGCG